MVAATPSRQTRRPQQPARKRGPDWVVRQPNLGVYLDRPSIDIDRRALSGCRNIRIKNGRIIQDGMGWENFPEHATDGARINLDNRHVLFIGEYLSRAGSRTMILCNQKDVFRYNPIPQTVTYMTPRYSVGTASSDGADTEVDGAGTSWNNPKATLPVQTSEYGFNAKAGDYISFGDAAEVELDATWWRIASVTDADTLTLDLNPGVNASGPYTIRQCLTGDNNDIFNAETFANAQPSGGATWSAGQDIFYLTNGKEMLEWEGAATQMIWFYPGFVGKGMITHKQTLAFWNVLEDGNQKASSIRFSRLLYPREFTTGGAGQLEPADGVGELLNVKPIGDQAAAYFDSNVVLMQYVGPPLYFVARVAVAGKGLIGQRAIMDFGDYHEFLSRDSSYRFDGVTLVPSMHQVFREVMRKVNPNRIRYSYAHIDEENGEVIWSVPLNVDGQATDEPPVTAYVQHYLEDVGESLPTPMTIRSYPFTATGTFRQVASGGLQFSDIPKDDNGIFAESAGRWDDRSFGEAFPLQVAGDANGDVYILNRRNTRNGVGFPNWATFPRIALWDGEAKGLVRRIEPFTTRRQGSSAYKLVVTLQTYDFADGDRVNAVNQLFDMTHQGRRYAAFRTAGRYGDVTFRTWLRGSGGGSISPQPWDLGGYKLTITPMGER